MFNLSLTQKKIALAFSGFFLVIGLYTAPVTRVAQAGWPVADVGNAATHGINAGSQASNTVAVWKDFALQLLKQVGMSIARVLLNKMTEATVNWINGGFQGSPKFVENPKSFFKGIGDTQLKNVVDTIGYNAAKFPYGREVAKLLIYDSIYNNSDFGTKAQSTLQNIVGSEWRRFSSHFAVGGWSGYEAYATNPANNPFGMLFLSIDEAARQTARQQQLIDKELSQGMGFLSQKTCTKYRDPVRGPISAAEAGEAETVENPDTQNLQEVNLNPGSDSTNMWGGGGSGFTPPGSVTGTTTGTTSTTTGTGTTTGGSSGTGGGTTGGTTGNTNILLGGARTEADCLEWKQLSPGSVVQSQINKALGSKVSQSELAQALGNSLSSIINALTTSLLNKGLSALSTIGSESAPTSSEWSYAGLTLSGIPTNALSGDNWANSPDQYVNFHELFYTGEDVGLTDENGVPVRLTIIEQAERQAEAYGALVKLMIGDSTNESFASRIKELDDVLPGPKFGWTKRLEDKLSSARQRWNQKAQTLVLKKNKEDAAEVADRLGDLSTSIPQEIKLQLLAANVPSFPDAQALIRNALAFSTREEQYVTSYTEALGTVSRLKNIKNRLDAVIANETSSLYTGSTIDTDLSQFLADNPGISAPVPNPFNYLTESGKQTLQSITKAYALIQKDLPNSATIYEAEASYAQVKAQYDNITLTINKILQEKNQNLTKHIYKVTYGGRKDSFVNIDKSLPFLFEKIDPTTLTQNQINQIRTNGFIYLTDPNQGNIISQTLNFVQDTLNPPAKVLLISPFGGSTPIPGIDDSDGSGFSQVTLNTGISKTQILQEFKDSYGSDSLDAEYKNVLEGLSNSNLTLAYSLVTTSTPLQDMGGGWDNNATGVTRLINALNLVADYEAATSMPVQERAERIFYCQGILDSYDDQSNKARNTYVSLFRRPKVDIKCSNIYHSDIGDYRVSQ